MTSTNRISDVITNPYSLLIEEGRNQMGQATEGECPLDGNPSMPIDICSSLPCEGQQGGEIRLKFTTSVKKYWEESDEVGQGHLQFLYSWRQLCLVCRSTHITSLGLFPYSSSHTNLFFFQSRNTLRYAVAYAYQDIG